MSKPKTAGQREALEFLHTFAKRPRKYSGAQPAAILKGYSGVGKTWVVSHFVHQHVKDTGQRVLICAPTNKALDVLRQKCGHVEGVDFRTIDAFLGYRVKKNDDGETEKRRHGKPMEYDIVLVDEASMVKSEYIRELLMQKALVVFIGDPAQLLPVGEDASTAFSAGDCDYLMTELVRTEEGNPIGELSEWLRHRVDDGRPYILQDVQAVCKERGWDNRISFIGLHKVHDWAEAAHRKGMDCRILAFDNATVHFHNERMHRRMFPDAELFGVGEYALANEAFELDDAEETLITNGEQFKVLACERIEDIAGVPVCAVTIALPHPLKWKVGDGKEHEVRAKHVVKVAMNAGAAQARHKELTDRIWDLRRSGGSYQQVDELLKLRNPLNKLAPLRHCYASTVHKAQGSTYDIAICDWGSIAKSRDMRARLMYVAATRPSKWLAFATK